MTQPTVILEMIKGPKPGTRFRLSGAAVTIGRSNEVEIPLPEVKSLSRRHTRLEMTDSGVRISDLGSQNGTYINGERITDPVDVSSGVVLRLGAVEFNITVDSPAGAAVAQAQPKVLARQDDYGVVAHEQGASALAPATTDEDMDALYADGDASRSSGRFLWLALVVVSLIVAGLYALQTLEQMKSPPLPPQYIIRAREPFTLRLPGIAEGFDNLKITSPGGGGEILRWKPFDGMLESEYTKNVVIIEGRAQGRAQVQVMRGGESTMSFTVHIRGTRPWEWEEDIPVEDAERLAARKLEAGRVLAKDQPYEAMQAFLDAEELYEIAAEPDLAMESGHEASQLRRRLRDVVVQLYEEARAELLGSATSRPNPLSAYEKLAEIKRLIPDQFSVDWQLANAVQQLASQEMERQSRHRGR